ncbi:MAG TPA: phosphoglycerate dehydrogenase, partial [Patescibacteria group bacterium]|nr:phosphoglycerate dehydrogenase [Patescibacteria group bacterium]
MRILVSDGLSPRGIEVLRQAEGFEIDERRKLTPEALQECIDNYDGLIVRSATKVTAPILRTAHRLKVVG